MVEVVPRAWEGTGLLGIFVRFGSYAGTHDHVMHIVDVLPRSPAAKAGLQGSNEYILGAIDALFETPEDFAGYIAYKRGSDVVFYVYNAQRDSVRQVSVSIPADGWEDGRPGIGVRVAAGHLHSLPEVATLGVNEYCGAGALGAAADGPAPVEQLRAGYTPEGDTACPATTQHASGTQPQVPLPAPSGGLELGPLPLAASSSSAESLFVGGATEQPRTSHLMQEASHAPAPTPAPAPAPAAAPAPAPVAAPAPAPAAAPAPAPVAAPAPAPVAPAHVSASSLFASPPAAEAGAAGQLPSAAAAASPTPPPGATPPSPPRAESPSETSPSADAGGAREGVNVPTRMDAAPVPANGGAGGLGWLWEGLGLTGDVDSLPQPGHKAPPSPVPAV